MELNLPKGNGQTRFLDYLNARLRERMANSTGSASFREDGLFESSVEGPMMVDQQEVPLIWHYVKSQNGELLHIEVERQGDEFVSVNWELAANLSDPFWLRPWPSVNRGSSGEVI